MIAIFFIFLYGFLGFVYYKLLKPYNVGFSFKNKNFAGLLIFKEFFALIGLSSVLLSLYPIYFFNGFDNTQQEGVIYISFLVWVSLFFYTISLFLGTNITYKWFYRNTGNTRSLQNLLFISIILAVALYFYLVFFYGIRHAFFDAIFKGESLLTTRLDNKYATNVPSFFLSILNIFIYFSIIIFSFSAIKSKIYSFLCVFIYLFLLTYGGGKAHLFNGIIIYILIKLSQLNHINLNISSIIKFCFVLISFIFLLIYIVKVQYPELNDEQLTKYFINRLGVGQMGGVYEQFNLNLYDPRYVYHSIPFASLFLDYPVFQKDLMLVSEGILDPTRTGIKNSLFISEASAFGWLYLILSPFIVGFNTAISIAIIALFLSKFYLSDRILSFKISTFLFLCMNALTGGFSEYMFFKSTIIILFSIGFVILVTKIFDFLVKK